MPKTKWGIAKEPTINNFNNIDNNIFWICSQKCGWTEDIRSISYQPKSTKYTWTFDPYCSYLISPLATSIYTSFNNAIKNNSTNHIHAIVVVDTYMKEMTDIKPEAQYSNAKRGGIEEQTI